MGLCFVAFYKPISSSEQLESMPASRWAPYTVSKLRDSVPSLLQAHPVIEMLS